MSTNPFAKKSNPFAKPVRARTYADTNSSGFGAASLVAPLKKRPRQEDTVEGNPASLPAQDALGSQLRQAPGDAGNAGALNLDQAARIEQNRLAALERKRQKMQGGDLAAGNANEVAKASLKESISDQATPCRQDVGAERRAGKDQKKPSRKQPKGSKDDDGGLKGSQESTKAADSDNEDAISVTTPAFSLPSTPDLSDEDGMEEACEDEEDGVMEEDSDADSDSSNSSSSDSSSSSNSSSSKSRATAGASRSWSSDSSSDSDSEADKVALAEESQVQPEMTEEQRAAEAEALAKKQQAIIEAKRNAALARKRYKEHLRAEAEAVAETPAPKPAAERDSKQNVVAQVLCRWWFCLPAWPPEHFDYDAVLLERGFRRVPMRMSDQEPEFDERGLRKAYELEQFKGCFRASDGDLVDCRPKEGRPSYDQMMLNSTPELYRLLLTAYDNQILELAAEKEKCGVSSELDGQLKELRKQAQAVRQKAMFFMSFKGKDESQKMQLEPNI